MGHDHHHNHDHGHDHGHAHAGHHHHHGNEKRVLWALLLTGGFMVAEVVGGLVSGSLALLADAGHMLTDAAALGLSLAAFRASRRPETLSHSYGQHRFQVLAAFLNGAALVAIALWIAVEAVQRMLAPTPVLGGTMLVVAGLGLVVNIAAFLILHGGDRENLNMRGAALHVLGDLLGSVAAIVAAVVIMATGWTPIDPILSVLVGGLVVKSAWLLLSRSWHVLMEGTPVHIDVAALTAELVEDVPGVAGIHHVHVWMLTPEQPLVTLHATITEDADHDAVLHGLQAVLADEFGLKHATIQVERAACPNPAGPH
jgi:cobalt-zinc-cadmium efflux system protein